MFKAIVLTVISLIGGLLIFFIAMSVYNYLLINAKSFAVLKYFGISKGFMTGILILQFSIGWLVLTILLAIITILSSIFFRPWLISMTGLDTLTHQIVALNFGIANGAVIIVGLFVSWWIVGRWWKQNKYVIDCFR